MFRLKARVRPRLRPGEMNKTERRYAQEVLAIRKHAGEIAAFWFEPITVKLAQRCTYTPDFLVQLADGSLEFHECKGHLEDDAAVKLRLVVELFPFPVILARYKGGAWSFEVRA